MAKVKTGFHCVQENKTYNVGDTYTGKRKDLKAFLEAPKKKPTTKKK